jgi:hypothetical protein
MSVPGSRAFTVGLLHPSGGPPVAATWFVNDVPQPGVGGTYTFAPTLPGRYVVKVVATDATPLVHPVMRPPSMWRSRTWTVYASPVGDLSVSIRADGEARDGQALAYTVAAANAGPDAVSARVTFTAPPQLTAASWTCAATAGSSCPPAGSGSVDASVSLLEGGSAAFTVAGTLAAGPARQVVSAARVYPPAGFADYDPANDASSLTTPVFKTLGFHTVAPCRMIDTRSTDAPALAAGTLRTFSASGRCAVPPTAWAVSLNVTVTASTGPGNLALFPAGTPTPLVSTANYAAGVTRANNAVVSLNGAGELAVRCNQAAGSVHLVVDVNGYFQ